MLVAFALRGRSLAWVCVVRLFCYVASVCLKVNEALVRKANLRYTVTIKLLRKAAKVHASERTILNALRARKIKFRSFREKPLLLPGRLRHTPFVQDAFCLVEKPAHDHRLQERLLPCRRR